MKMLTLEMLILESSSLGRGFALLQPTCGPQSAQASRI